MQTLAWPTGAFNRCMFPLCSTKRPVFSADLHLKASPDHSFMGTSHSESTIFTEQHDNRAVGETLEERLDVGGNTFTATPRGERGRMTHSTHTLVAAKPIVYVCSNGHDLNSSLSITDVVTCAIDAGSVKNKSLNGGKTLKSLSSVGLLLPTYG